MGLLDAYADSTENVLNVMAARPVDPEPAKPKHSAWSAIPRAVASAATEIGGNIIDTAAAYGQVAAASGGLTPGFDPDQTKNRAASVEAMDKLKTEGIDWRTEESQTQYAYARDLRPDPVTAGHAENLVFGLTRGLTKAVGAATTLGPVAGALAFGGSEGMTDADALAAQGVDLATRTKVGAVSAAMNAAGVALPVAGKTLAQTVGLVAVGGPLSFMTQQQATRSILEAADYHDIAKQYDPLDPVGLTVATLVPAGFAAAARAGARGGAKAPDIVPTRDDIDAAMVHNLTATRDAYEATPPEKFAAELWRGPVTENPNFKAWFGDSKVAGEDGSPMVVYHGTAAEFDSFDRTKSGSSIDSGKLGEGFYFSQSNRWAGSYAENAAKRSDGGASVMPVYLSIKNPVVLEGPGNVWDKLRAISSEWGISGSPVLDEAMTPNPEWSKAFTAEATRRGFDGVVLPSKFGDTEYVAFREDQIKSAIGNSGKFDPNSGSLTDRIEPTAPAKPAEDVTPDAYRARVEQLVTEQPDLVARLDEAGQPVRLADELDAVRKAAQEGTDTEFGALDAPLLKVAAECALATGTAAL